MPPRNLPWQKRTQSTTDSNEEALVSRPLGQRLPGNLKAHFAAIVSEFVGTFLFLLVSLPGHVRSIDASRTLTTSSHRQFALGGTHVVNTTSGPAPANQDPAKLLYISLCFGVSLAVNVW